MHGEEIFSEIDSTLDQLIENAKFVNNPALKFATKEQRRTFQIRQKKLLAHLLHLDGKVRTASISLRSYIGTKSPYPIQEKLLHLQKLNKQWIYKYKKKKQRKAAPRNRKKMIYSEE